MIQQNLAENTTSNENESGTSFSKTKDVPITPTRQKPSSKSVMSPTDLGKEITSNTFSIASNVSPPRKEVGVSSPILPFRSFGGASTGSFAACRSIQTQHFVPATPPRSIPIPPFLDDRNNEDGLDANMSVKKKTVRATSDNQQKNPIPRPNLKSSSTNAENTLLSTSKSNEYEAEYMHENHSQQQVKEVKKHHNIVPSPKVIDEPKVSGEMISKSSANHSNCSRSHVISEGNSKIVTTGNTPLDRRDDRETKGEIAKRDKVDSIENVEMTRKGVDKENGTECLKNETSYEISKISKSGEILGASQQEDHSCIAEKDGLQEEASSNAFCVSKILPKTKGETNNMVDILPESDVKFSSDNKQLGTVQSVPEKTQVITEDPGFDPFATSFPEVLDSNQDGEAFTEEWTANFENFDDESIQSKERSHVAEEEMHEMANTLQHDNCEFISDISKAEYKMIERAKINNGNLFDSVDSNAAETKGLIDDESKVEKQSEESPEVRKEGGVQEVTHLNTEEDASAIKRDDKEFNQVEPPGFKTGESSVQNENCDEVNTVVGKPLSPNVDPCTKDEKNEIEQNDSTLKTLKEATKDIKQDPNIPSENAPSINTRSPSVVKAPEGVSSQPADHTKDDIKNNPYPTTSTKCGCVIS